MLFVYLQLIAGFVLLVFAGDALVRGAVSLALRLGIAPLIIGLTIVGFGTSAPELVISLDAALNASTGMAIGNIVGSNIANILLVLGVPALISPTNCNQPLIGRNMLYLIGATLVFIALCFTAPLHLWQGGLLFTLMIAFLILTGFQSPDHLSSDDVTEESDARRKLPQIIALIVLGVIGLPAGAHLIVVSGSEIARTFGISETVIGLTLFAVGTSLPELTATSIAAIRGQAGMALGNVLGSCMFNVLAIMGIAALIVPIPVPETLLKFDLWVMLGAVLLISPVIFRRGVITRATGALLLLTYIVYIIAVFMMNTGDLAAGS